MSIALFSRRRRTGIATAAGAGMAGVLLAVVYPWVLESSLDRVGVRVMALGMLLLIPGSLALRWRAPGARSDRAMARAGTLSALAFGLLLVAAAVTQEPVALRLISAVVYAGLAAQFAASLRSEGSIVESGARWLVPEVPDFIRGYCRVVTGMWAAFFAGIAVALSFFAFDGSPSRWQTLSGWTVWTLIGGISIAEFLVRKSWFRHYPHGGPFERFWSTWFPSENTPRGRRSMESIRRWRERQRDGA